MGRAELKKKAFLCAYDYGMGARWMYIKAKSAEDIRRELPALMVYDEPPPFLFLTKKYLENLAAKRTLDLEEGLETDNAPLAGVISEVRSKGEAAQKPKGERNP